MKGKAKEARLQMRLNAELFEWFDQYAKERRTDRTKILTGFIEMLWAIEHGRSGKGEGYKTTND